MKYCILIASCVFLLSCKEKSLPLPAKEPDSIEVKDSLQDDILVQNIKMGNDSVDFRFMGSYPETRYVFVNRMEKSFTEDYLTEFKETTNELHTREKDSLRPQIEYSQHFEIIVKSGKLLGFLYTRSQNEGNNASKQFFAHYFNLIDEKPLQVEGMFRDYDSFKNFATEVKSIVQDTLKNIVYKDKTIEDKDKELAYSNLKTMIAEGTEASADNYKSMVWQTNGNWKIIFDKYAVAPGSFGEITIEIQKSQIAPYLKENFIHLITEEIETPPSTAEAKEMVVQTDSVENKIDCGKVPCVALTFDDGPSAYTPRLLDILKENNVKATFFILGRSAKVQKNTVLRAYQEGHEIENHTWNHKNLVKLNSAQIKEEINNTDALLEEIIGKKSTYLRPPYGSFNKKVRAHTKKPCILWTIDPLDWKERNTDVIAQRLSQAQPNTILLAHDTHKTTVEAIPEVIKRLKEKGYHFVTIEQLFEGQKLENGGKYRKRKSK